MLSKLPFRASRWLAVALVAMAVCAAPRAYPADPPSGEGWEQIDKRGGLTIYARNRPGTSIRETRAVGTLEAPNWVIKNVLDDVENYPSFMPYIVESKLLARNAAKHTLTVYTRMTPPLIDPRDYTLFIRDDSRKTPEGITYGSHWNAANAQGPEEKPGTVRVKNNEGSWLLEPIDGGERTKGTYTLFTDGGGGIPAFIFNQLSKRRLNELFEVLNKQSKDEKYRQNKPAVP
ncbi:MAG: hypothetical protein INR62_11500 [Rhodospirillales bacterium]|nr:hypothetical protein [Acetobacter sp.]